jgi:hypothetical protein
MTIKEVLDIVENKPRLAIFALLLLAFTPTAGIATYMYTTKESAIKECQERSDKINAERNEEYKLLYVRYEDYLINAVKASEERSNKLEKLIYENYTLRKQNSEIINELKSK